MWVVTTVLGVAVLAATVLDALVTTINVSERPAPVARSVLAGTRRPLRAVLRGRYRVAVGLVQTALMLATWAGLLWVGWWLVLLAEPVVLVRGDGGAVAGVVDHLYVAGYALFTLGNGDFTPATASAQLLTVLAAATGLGVVTLEVTYLLGLTGAAQHKRRLARMVHGMGPDAPEIVRRAWTGRDFSAAAQLLDSVATDLVELAEHHTAFPVLHEFAASRRELAVGPALLELLDAVRLMEAPEEPDARIPELPAAMVRAAVDELLYSMPQLEPHTEPPPPPGPGVLDELDIAVDPAARDGGPVDEPEHTRRRDLHAFGVHEGWGPMAARMG